MELVPTTLNCSKCSGGGVQDGRPRNVSMTVHSGQPQGLNPESRDYPGSTLCVARRQPRSIQHPHDRPIKHVVTGPDTNSLSPSELNLAACSRGHCAEAADHDAEAAEMWQSRHRIDMISRARSKYLGTSCASRHSRSVPFDHPVLIPHQAPAGTVATMSGPISQPAPAPSHNLASAASISPRRHHSAATRGSR